MGVMTISISDDTEQKLRDYRNSIPGVPPKLSAIIENAILEKLEREKKLA